MRKGVRCALGKSTTLPQRYLTVGHGSKGLELPHFFLDSGEEVLPAFSSEEAAQGFLVGRDDIVGSYARRRKPRSSRRRISLAFGLNRTT